MNFAPERPSIRRGMTTAAVCLAGGLLSIALIATTAANAQEVFRWVDKAGKVHYGDMPPPPADVKTLQTKKLSDSVIEQEPVPFGVSTAMKNNPVTLYANACGEACSNAKTLLSKRGISYTEKNPQTDSAAAATLTALVGAVQVPTVVIGANKLSGFDEEGWNSALSSAGYPRYNPNVRQGAVKAGPQAPTPAPAK